MSTAKTIVLGVTGSIAAYKAVDIARLNLGRPDYPLGMAVAEETGIGGCGRWDGSEDAAVMCLQEYLTSPYLPCAQASWWRCSLWCTLARAACTCP